MSLNRAKEICCGIIILSVTGLTFAQSNSSGVHRQVIDEGNNRLAMHMMKVSVKDGKNFVSSPWSIYSSLFVLMRITAGNSKLQIQGVITNTKNETTNETDVIKSMSLARKRLEKMEDVTYKTETFLLVKETFPRMDWLKKKFLPDRITFDCLSNLSNINEAINKSFSAEKSPAGFLKIPKPDEETIALLYNYVYFKGTWKDLFEKQETLKPFNFRDNGRKCKMDVSTMRANTAIAFLNREHQLFDFIGLLFNGKQMAFAFMIPKNNEIPLEEALNAVKENQGNTAFLTEMMDELFNEDNEIVLDLEMPKFRIEYDFPDLKTTLESLGILDIFSPRDANFSPLDRTKSLLVTKVEQKAFITVDEGGVEAGGVTSAAISLRSFSEAKIYKIDRSFGFFIVETKTTKVLFSGALIKPHQGAMECAE